MRRSPALPTLAATVVALALTGCGGGGSSDSAKDEVGPVSAFYEKFGGSYSEDDHVADQRKYEEVVAACMAEEGFEYTPAEPQSGGVVLSGDMPDWESKEYAEQYGYGATTGSELFGGSDEEYVDPNADYLAGMSESEQAEFYTALYGEMPEVDPEADPAADSEELETEYSWETAGCAGEATHEVYEKGQVLADPAVTDMQLEMTDGYEKISDDPGLRESLKKWSACMAEEGYDYATPDEAQQSILDEHSAINEPPLGEDGEIDPNATFEPDQAALAELKEKELKLAVADWDCKQSSGYATAFKGAVLALEKRVWEKYGDALEAAAAKQTPAE